MNWDDWDAEIQRILDEFYARVYSDTMIGYLFSSFDKVELTRSQKAFTKCMLLGTKYPGRPLGKVHRPLRLKKGHFMRRRKILLDVLGSSALPQDIQASWIEKEQLLFDQVVLTAKECSS